MLEIDNLTIKVSSEHFIELEKFKICEGTRLRVAGGSGSGKTQFLKALSLIKEFSCSKFSFSENGLKTNDMFELKKRIKFIPQHTTFPNVSIKEIALFMQKFEFGQTDVLKNFNLISQKVLSISMDKKISTLSGGERQLVHLILILSSKPKMLILDESFSAMDKRMRDIAESLVLDYSKEIGLLFVHHLESEGFLKPTHILSLSDKNLKIMKSSIHQLSSED